MVLPTYALPDVNLAAVWTAKDQGDDYDPVGAERQQAI